MTTVSKRKVQELQAMPHSAAVGQSDTESDDSHTDEDDTRPYVSKTAQRATKAVKKDDVGTVSTIVQQKGSTNNAISNALSNAPAAKAATSASASTVKPSKATTPSSGPSSFFAPRSERQRAAMSIDWQDPLGPEQSCVLGVFGDPLGHAINTAASTPGASSSSSSASAPAPAVASSSSSSTLQPRRLQKIAAFDLDDTLIHTASGKQPFRFTDENDWKIWGGSAKERDIVLEAVRKESDAGSLMVILTSQKNLDTRPGRLGVWQMRMGLIASRIGRPFIVFAALRDDGYRKPRTAWVEELKQMWQASGGEEAVGPLDAEIGGRAGPIDDDTRSFFVGDAAGRGPGGRRTKADFSDTDRKLASNLGWRFFTPEEYWLKEPAEPYMYRGYHPDIALDGSAIPPSSLALTPSPLSGLLSRLLAPTNPQTLLILVGPQASGKSHIARRLASSTSWVRVNRDTLGSQQRCLNAATEALRAGKSVVIDNTSPARNVRRAYLDLIQDPEIPAVARKVAVHFDLPLPVVLHNEWYRVEYGESAAPAGEPRRGKLPQIAFSTYYRTLEAPAMEGNEGWDEVVRVQQFTYEGSEEMRRKWAQWFS